MFIRSSCDTLPADIVVPRISSGRLQKRAMPSETQTSLNLAPNPS